MPLRLFLVFSILVGLFSACSLERETALSAEMKEQIALLPQDAGAYGYVNIQRLHKAEFARFFVDSIKQHLTESEEFQAFIAETGLDPEKDIHQAYFALQAGSKRNKPLGLVVAGGKFDAQKIIGFLKEKDKHHKLQEEKISGHTVYSIPEKPIAFCFYNSETLVGGEYNLVIKWIKNSDADKPQKSIDPELLTELKSLKYKQGMWLSVSPGIWKAQIKDHGLRKLNALKSLTGLGFSMDVTDKIKFSAKGNFNDKEKARLFKEAIKGFIATGKLSISDDREIINILNGIQVKVDDGQVTLDFKINEKEIKQLMNKQKTLKKKIFKAV